MHEYSIACEILDQVLKTAKLHEAKEIKSVTLELGQLAHTNPDQLAFCFDVLAKESLAEGAELKVEMKAPTIECDCGYSGPVKKPSAACAEEKLQSELLEYISALACPKCGKNARIAGGRELLIKTIDIEI
ncbi:MAG: hydrogenase maturation nickel metallochaperone HypA [Methanosarcinaceae archaeon]|nr:hydrogenase maturation nickel metallochaperone HypA [Methanosarcinaceae archaeon]MDD4331450.1 hydrogenase maturation nickel metallochaperone HypA [Methanosarcinaceae archaeon]MDD4749956.1 hydrogenase maturation nickel metallochaperone HypA [Methanosarcinaceae archaeon]